MSSKPAANYNEDLFEETKMTFGQHLEELRSALFKAVLALTIGTCLGLYFGETIVYVIELPLKQALDQYYTERDQEKLIQAIQDKLEAGEAIPGNPDEWAEDPEKLDLYLTNLANFMATNQLTFDQMLIDGENLLQELQQQYPEQFAGMTLADSLAEATANPAENNNAANTAATGNVAPTLPSIEERKVLRLFVWRKLKDTDRAKLSTLNAQEAFVIWLKAGLIFGFLISSPLIFWFIWDFVRVGLYPHERRYVNLFLPLSIFLFLAGAALAFFFVFQYVLGFLFTFNKMLGLEPDMRISEWLSFALFMPVGFGISFQLPLVMLFLERIGVFNVEIYLSKWRIAILVIAIIAMILTPADPTSMMMMALPLWGLYFVGIALCRYLPRGRSPFSDPIE